MKTSQQRAVVPGTSTELARLSPPLDNPGMDDNLPKRRSWFRFSLRTMFVLVTVLCIWLGWVGRTVQQRLAFLPQIKYTGVTVETAEAAARIPFYRRWFGDRAFEVLILVDRKDFEEGKKLFPEAQVLWEATEDDPVSPPVGSGTRSGRKVPPPRR